MRAGLGTARGLRPRGGAQERHAIADGRRRWSAPGQAGRRCELGDGIRRGLWPEYGEGLTVELAPRVVVAERARALYVSERADGCGLGAEEANERAKEAADEDDGRGQEADERKLGEGGVAGGEGVGVHDAGDDADVQENDDEEQDELRLPAGAEAEDGHVEELGDEESTAGAHAEEANEEREISEVGGEAAEGGEDAGQVNGDEKEPAGAGKADRGAATARVGGSRTSAPGCHGCHAVILGRTA